MTSDVRFEFFMDNTNRTLGASTTRKHRRKKSESDSLAYSSSSQTEGESSDSSVTNEDDTKIARRIRMLLDDDVYSGQPTDSQNDGGPNRYVQRTNNTAQAPILDVQRRKLPATVAPSDMSSNSGNTGLSPPPRHYRREITDTGTEVWYAKWWMCGFTDALNINSN